MCAPEHVLKIIYIYIYIYILWVSLVAQLVKNLPTMQETPVQSLGPEDPLEMRMPTPSSIPGASLVVHMVKNLPAIRETLV